MVLADIRLEYDPAEITPEVSEIARRARTAFDATRREIQVREARMLLASKLPPASKQYYGLMILLMFEGTNDDQLWLCRRLVDVAGAEVYEWQVIN